MKAIHRNLYSMGTRLDLVLVDIDDKKADRLLSQVSNTLEDLVNILSIYKPDSELSLLNNKAATEPVIVSKNLFEILERCVYFYNITSGIFDISARLDDKDPGNNTHQGIGALELNREELCVRFLNGQLRLDPGGFGKGLALEEIRKILIEAGVENALVSFGESSVMGQGTHPYGDFWPIGISNIFDTSQNIKVVELVNSGLSTSGSGTLDNSGQFRSYNNIINPRTADPVMEACTVSVRCDDMVLAEALSTALLIDTECIKTVESIKPSFEAYRVNYNAEQQFELVELFV